MTWAVGCPLGHIAKGAGSCATTWRTLGLRATAEGAMRLVGGRRGGPGAEGLAQEAAAAVAAGRGEGVRAAQRRLLPVRDALPGKPRT